MHCVRSYETADTLPHADVAGDRAVVPERLQRWLEGKYGIFAPGTRAATGCFGMVLVNIKYDY